VVPSDIVNILNIREKIDNFMLSDMNRRLPFDNGLFTEIVCIDGIEHIERPFDFIRECNKVRTNRIKAISYLYSIFYPLLYMITSMVYSKEENDFGQRTRNAEIKRAMFSKFVYFGETLIICARKK
jgi:hypothetical protein